MASPPVNVTSFGPAGTPHNIQESGANILETFCRGYPDTQTHSIIPAFFDNNVTELMEPKQNLTIEQNRKVHGRTINQTGEGYELEVFNMFVRLTRQMDISPTMLVMRTFEMDNNNPISLKKHALTHLLPGISFKSVNTESENDFVVLVKNLGVVFVEVKASKSDSKVVTAEKQLANVDGIVQSIMKAMSSDEKRIIPTVKLILIPSCMEETPIDPTSCGSYFIFQDACRNFEEKWQRVIKELTQIKAVHSFTPEEFKCLSQILVGVWSAKAVRTKLPTGRGYELKQEETEVSDARQLKKIDKLVDTGTVRNEDKFKSSTDKLNPLTKQIRTKDNDIFRSCSDLKLCYLTPDQHQLFRYQKQAIVHSSAGCGKSLLILFKAVELVNTPGFSDRILLLAPDPHYLRIRNALRLNNIPVDVIEQFPPPPSSSTVFLMDMEKFFKVEPSTLMAYDLSNYHVFVDDLQHLDCVLGENNTTYHDIRNFIEQAFDVSVKHATYLWVMLDVVQGMDSDIGAGRYSHDLFFSPDKEPCSIKTPIVKTLSHVMRNAHEVMKMNIEARTKYVQNSPITQISLPSPQVGHKITSRVPVYHKLHQCTEKEHVTSFILERLREELEALVKSPDPLPLSDIAVIYNNRQSFNWYKGNITSFLTNEFGTTPQTIKEQLNSNNTSDIIMDVETQLPSFEAPNVIFLCTCGGPGISRSSYYMIGTRARVSITIIDVAIYSPPLSYDTMDTVPWEAVVSTKEKGILNQFKRRSLKRSVKAATWTPATPEDKKMHRSVTFTKSN